MEGFAPASLLAVVGLLGFAGRDLTTRAAPASLSHMQLGACGFAILVPTGGALLAHTGDAVLPRPGESAALAAAVLIGVAAYYALTVAMRRGEVSVVAPFRYTRLVFALILGVVVFAERPDAATLIGAAVIVGSGPCTLIRSRRAGTTYQP